MKSKAVTVDGKVLKSSQFTSTLIKEVIFGVKPVNTDNSNSKKIKNKNGIKEALVKKNENNNKKKTMNLTRKK